MIARVLSAIRHSWHPLWRLRKLRGFRAFQRRWDRTVYTRIPQTDLQVGVKLFRDAGWIFAADRHEPEIRRAFSLALKVTQPTTFWDIGANIGFYSWLVRKDPAVQNIVMFEPDPTNFALIQGTIEKNAVTNCRALNVALADQEGEALFLVDYASGATGSLWEEPDPKNTHSLHHVYQLNETINCRTATIDGLIREGIAPPQLIKIDVEGAERRVIVGGGLCLANYRPTMIVETYEPDLVRRLLPDNYAAFQINSDNMLLISAADEFDLTSLDSAFPRCK